MAITKKAIGSVITIPNAYFGAVAVENTGAAATQWSEASTFATLTVSVTSTNEAYSFDIGILSRGRYAIDISAGDASTILSGYRLTNAQNPVQTTMSVPYELKTMFPVGEGDSTHYYFRVDNIAAQSSDTLTVTIKRIDY